MSKRIFRAMGSLVLFTVLFFALLFGLIFSNTFGSKLQDSLKSLRVSMIAPSGEVIFDNLADSSTLENHESRPEVAEALKKGAGESKRFSTTLLETTYYYAKKMNNGNILRLSVTTDSIQTLLTTFIPLVLICLAVAFLVAFFLAKTLTKRITDPINHVDLDHPTLEKYEELLPFFKKIESQKQALNAQLIELKQRTRTITTITENMKEGLLLLDEKGNILLTNDSLRHILHMKNLLNVPFIEVYREQHFIENVKKCLKGEKSEMMISFPPDFYQVYFNPVKENGQLQGAVILFINNTQHFLAETQRKEFSANVSHELKTPLTTISVISEMLGEGSVKEKDIQPFAKKIQIQAKRLLNIIEDIIKLAEFDEGKTQRDFSVFNLNKLAQKVVDHLKEKSEKNQVKVTLIGEKNIYLTGNEQMIDELLYNLLDNGIKYNQKSGTVTITLKETSTSVKIIVKDTGIGIESKDFQRIFERFYRVDKSHSKKIGGTGLGLSIVKHIVEFHQGSIKVESQSTGTTFTVVLPKS